jgi:hypothetical protein
MRNRATTRSDKLCAVNDLQLALIIEVPDGR